MGRLFNDLSAALDALPAAFVLYDVDEKIVICNKAYRREYHPFEDFVQPGVSHTELQWLKVNEGLDSNAIGREKDFVRDEQMRHRTGPKEEEWQDEHGRFIRLLRARLPDGGVAGMRFDITDLRLAQKALEAQNSKLEQAQHALSELANSDELTGLPNRRAASAGLQDIAATSAARNEKVVILQVDLDGFKAVNDDLGHDAGDCVLVQAAKRLDTLVPDGGMLARVGGDEFQFVLSGRQMATEALSLGNRIVQTIGSPFHYENRVCQIGASVGIAISQGAATDVNELVKRADIALYKSKQSGRGQVSVFQKEMAKEQEKLQRIGAALQQTGFSKNFCFEFQAIVSATDHTLTGMEVFPIWRDPQHGMIGFEDVQSIADDMNAGARVSLGALAGFLDWHAATGKGTAPLPLVSMRVSERLLVEPDLLKTLSGHDFPEGGMLFVVDEQRLRALGGDRLVWNVEGLRERGLDISFGGVGARTPAGTLQTFSPKTLVLSPDVVRLIDEQVDTAGVVRLVMAQARVLGAQVTAKSVDKSEQAALLRELGCDHLQGDYIAGAFPADDYDASSDKVLPRRA